MSRTPEPQNRSSDKEVLEKLLGVDTTHEAPSDSIGFDDSMPVIEESFGQGANKRVLLVTKGLSLKKIVEASK